MATTEAHEQQDLGFCAGSSCAQEVQAAVKLLAGAWAVPVLEGLAFATARTCRFRELQRRASGISQKELSRQLGTYMDAGIVHRQALSAQRVEYRLSARGEALLAIADTLGQWKKAEPARAASFVDVRKLRSSWLTPLMPASADEPLS